MTTIATDGKSMAGDGLVTLDSYVVGTSSKKVRRIPSGQIVGFCGESGEDVRFIEWLESGGKPIKLSVSFAALVIGGDDPPRVYFNDCTHDDIDGPYAIGSGARFALAAMDCGKSPEEAVSIAAGRCCHTGGDITALSLEQPKLAAA